MSNFDKAYKKALLYISNCKGASWHKKKLEDIQLTKLPNLDGKKVFSLGLAFAQVANPAEFDKAQTSLRQQAFDLQGDGVVGIHHQTAISSDGPVTTMLGTVVSLSDPAFNHPAFNHPAFKK